MKISWGAGHDMSSVGMLVWRSAGCWTRGSTGMIDMGVSWEAGHVRKLGS